MFRVLMVDDEEIALEALKKGINWAELHVGTIFTATNIFDAKTI